MICENIFCNNHTMTLYKTYNRKKMIDINTCEGCYNRWKETNRDYNTDIDYVKQYWNECKEIEEQAISQHKKEIQNHKDRLKYINKMLSHEDLK